MKCPFYTKIKKEWVCKRYSCTYFQQPCPFDGDLDRCKEEGASRDPPLELPL